MSRTHSPGGWRRWRPAHRRPGSEAAAAQL